MTEDTAALYTALAARDARFDGVFYVGVTSTGIYCRPVCTAKTPKAANCRFFNSAAAAEKANFRPCLRCRPELAPGNAPVDDTRRISALVARRIDEGMLDDGASLELMAKEFGWSSRQIRRIMQKELGVSPIDLVQTRRLLLAKQLLTETALPITDVAFASGFASIRRFNDAFNVRYGMAPTRFRKAADVTGATKAASDAFTLQLAYRPPFDWKGVLRFLGARAVKGVEHVDADSYTRTVRIGNHVGWIRARNATAQNALLLDVTHTLTPVLTPLLGKLRQLFDLSARPDVIAGYLGQDDVLGAAVASNPGLRVPGAFDGFELAVRAILGQQITVKAATTIAGRYAEAFGAPFDMPPENCLARLTPTADRVAGASVSELASLGIIQTRAKSIIAIATEIASGRLRLEAGGDPDQVIQRLVNLPGIGAWTAHYIAMRALRWPDAFPKEDLVVRKRLGGVTSRRAEEMSQPWRPWRAYAVLHLWQSTATPAESSEGLAVT